MKLFTILSLLANVGEKKETDNLKVSKTEQKEFRPL